MKHTPGPWKIESESNIRKCSNCLHKSNSSMVYLCNTCGMYDDYPNWKAFEPKTELKLVLYVR